MTDGAPNRARRRAVLLILNGPPGIGKSTIARRYADDVPLALRLDVDEVRGLLGGWQRRAHDAGLLARTLAETMAMMHLKAGHDVVVPQYVGRPRFLGELARVAEVAGAVLVEVVLMDDRDAALARLAARRGGPAVTEAEAGEMYDRLVAMLPERPRAVVVQAPEGDVDGTYAAVRAAVAARAPGHRDPAGDDTWKHGRTAVAALDPDAFGDHGVVDREVIPPFDGSPYGIDGYLIVAKDADLPAAEAARDVLLARVHERLREAGFPDDAVTSFQLRFASREAIERHPGGRFGYFR